MRDVELYQHADSLPKGKEDKDFVKKPDIALKLVNQTIKRKYRRPNCFNRWGVW